MSRRGKKNEPREWLRVMAGPDKGSMIELDPAGRMSIGRSSACEITLQDLSVSRKHAELHKTPSGRWRVRDLGSRNGIAVDGESSSGWLVVEPRSTIAIGDVELRFEGCLDDELDLDEPETDPSPAAPPAASRSPDDPPSLPDLEPPKLDLPPPPWREGVRSTGALRDQDEERPSRPPYLLGAAIGLGTALAVAGLLVLLGQMQKERPEPSIPEPSVAETDRASANALVSLGRDAASEGRWSDVEAAARDALAKDADNEGARELLELAARERRALAEVVAAEDAFELGELAEAKLLAEDVHALSQYRERADRILDRIERGDTSPTEEATVAEADPSQTKVAQSRPRPARRPQTTKRPSRPASRPQARKTASGPDPIVAEAREAFSRGRVSDARAGAEAAADAGISGAGALLRQLDAFHEASRTADGARGRGQLPLALAHYTDALALARELSPPSGGRPGAEVSGRLADLHYQSARQSLERDDRGAARAHLERALTFQPNHSGARSLLEGL